MAPNYAASKMTDGYESAAGSAAGDGGGNVTLNADEELNLSAGGSGSDAAVAITTAGGGGPPKTERPLGPDGKPIPGPEDMRKIQSQRKMNQQQAQVDEVIGIMHKNVEAV